MGNGIEFRIWQNVDVMPNGFVIRGRAGREPIGLNSIFYCLKRDKVEFHNIALRVIGITAYQRELEILGYGMSGELRCIGTSEIMPADNDLLVG